jgi:hypothetical protein
MGSPQLTLTCGAGMARSLAGQGTRPVPRSQTPSLSGQGDQLPTGGHAEARADAPTRERGDGLGMKVPALVRHSI